LVDGVQYDDVCIRNSKEPIALTTNYGAETHGDKLPVFQNILLHNVRISGGGTIQLEGLDVTHRIGIRLDGVVASDGPAQYKMSVKHADVTLGPGPVNLLLSGTDSTEQGKAGTGALAGCGDKFVAFPVNP
jgi:polygalacturonase